MSELRKQYHEVIVVGGGPAGSSAAIHLAQQDISVLLIEQKRFPRAKLCGEFISPECVDHFEKLGAAANMQASEPAEITETVFYSRRGRRLVIPSSWFGGSFALGLSRAEMDNNLLRRAKDLGVNVLEETSVIALIEEQNSVTGVRVRTHNVEHEYGTSIVVDATGRSRAVIRKLGRLDATRHEKPKLVAFKVHLEGSRATPSTCTVV
jgi:flavin-dependent dehydrogenase